MTRHGGVSDMNADQRTEGAGGARSTADEAVRLRGDCGVVLRIETPCPDAAPTDLPMHCGCGAEVYVADPEC